MDQQKIWEEGRGFAHLGNLRVITVAVSITMLLSYNGSKETISILNFSKSNRIVHF